MKILLIIPARKGSKGVPKKNSRLLGNKPLVSYTIELAKKFKSDQVDILVTSDCKNILSIARKNNVITYLRSNALSDDKATMLDVVEDVLKNVNKEYESIILLQPTCPFRKEKHLKEAIDILESKKYSSAISYIKVDDHHPARMYKIKNNLMEPLEPKYESLNRQDLPNIYLRSGSIYGISVEVFLTTRTFFQKDAYMILHESPIEAVNIDNELDFLLAQTIIENKLFN